LLLLGACWVSYKCFEVEPVSHYVDQLVSQFPNLKIFKNTVIKSTSILPDSSSLTTSSSSSVNHISEVIAIHRKSRNDSLTGYENLFSNDFEDWYSSEDSELFTKEIITFSFPKVVIEATEYSDVLITSGIEYSQGVEYPTELSDTTDSTCGQSTVYPFYMSYEASPVKDDSVPVGSDNDIPFSMDGLTWDQVWTYRRAKHPSGGSWNDVSKGDQSNQNLDNDYRVGYLFKSMEDIQAELTSNEGWKGGFNKTSLSASEQRSYGWYHYLKNTANTSIVSYLTMNRTETGTSHGLVKVPYIRDTRRSKYGIDKFRLTYDDLNYSNPADNGATARPFVDTIGIGVYHYADIHTLLPQNNCFMNNGTYPNYITCCSHPVKPYYLPFRALTNEKLSNVLIPGKGMAQSFLANAATRLHPMEWVTGTAAGAAAVLMLEKGWNSIIDVYQNIQQLQILLESDVIKSPLTWTL
jgi:hypothetical protein